MTAAVLCCVLALWPVAALLGGQAFAALTGLAALVTSPASIPRLRPRLYMLALLAFFAFCAASVFWSPKPFALIEYDFSKLQFSVRSDVLRVSLLFLAGGALIAIAQALSSRSRLMLSRIAVGAMLVQLVVVALLTVFETQAIELIYPGRPDDEGVQNISRNCLIMAAAAPFLVLGLINGRSRATAAIIAVLVLGAEIAILAKREVYAGLLAMAMSFAGIVLVRFVPRHGFRVIGFLLALIILSAPAWTWAAARGADAAVASSTVDYRQIIWSRVLVEVADKPVMGAGVGALRTIKDRIPEGAFAHELVVPNHPHNMPLQLWAETGAIGAVLLSLAIVLAAFRLPHPATMGPAALRIAALAGSMAAIGCVSFDLWNEWWWAVGALLAVLTAAAPATTDRREQPDAGSDPQPVPAGAPS